MTSISYVNGRYVYHKQALIHIEDRGFQLADGVYEVIAIKDSKLLHHDLHLQRLTRSLAEIAINPPVSNNSFLIIANELIRKNKFKDGVLYAQITRGVSRRAHSFPQPLPNPSLVMALYPTKSPTPDQLENGVKVITLPDWRWKRRDIKSISLLANVLAKETAKKQLAYECWFHDDHEVISEGSSSNAYIVGIDGEIITHPANNNILAGITRHTVITAARNAGFRVTERPFTKHEALSAAEAFLTSTSNKVLPVIAINDSPIANGKPGPVTRQLRSLID